ncbi:MAG: hypothetical protein GY849_02390 [Deltaproteobacteria bacterium]|nr:hypothetical protein [Deltaproteobacteria bacterium]
MKKINNKVFEIKGTVYNIDVLTDLEFEKLTGLKKSEYGNEKVIPKISKKKQSGNKPKNTAKLKK